LLVAPRAPTARALLGIVAWAFERLGTHRAAAFKKTLG
jgi:hypothetical protein